jgi:trehalose/maltose hydrolase-like predicted phosphorylase
METASDGTERARQRSELQDSSGEEQAWSRRLLEPTRDPLWQLRAAPYAPALEGQVEAELALGNGSIGMRAVLPFAMPGAEPRIYVAGLFGQPPGPVVSPVLFSAPIWLYLQLTIDGEAVTPETGELIQEERTLDLRRALLIEALSWRGRGGHLLYLRTARLASQDQRALGLTYAELTVEQPALLALEASAREAPGFPLELVARLEEGLDSWRTPQGRHWLAMTLDAAVEVQGQALRPMRTTSGTSGTAGMRWQWRAFPGYPARFTQFAVLCRGDGVQGEETSRAAARAARHVMLQQGTGALLDAHERTWEQRWTASDVVVEGDEAAQRALRFASYHMLSAANPADDRISVGARALTGDEYHGHVFWDTDLFLLPFYLYTWPEAARALLLYRYHGLAGAREKAAKHGNRGAFYAWEAADTGDEATPRGVLGPDGREVVYTVADQAVHINADIAYAVWQYWQITGDDVFLRDAGAEILLETARFWASRVERGSNGAYHLRGVQGPDEYHQDVDDNAYTNNLARWNLARARDAAEWLRERWPSQWSDLQQRLHFAGAELETWRQVADQLVTGFDPATGLFEQFAGFSKLAYIDLASITPPSPTVDLVLGQERTGRSQVVKQADVVMLLALLWDTFTPEVCAANFAYYAPRTSQGSSLSPAIHALVAARLGDVATAEGYFRQAAEIDERDIRRDTSLGVHIATQGGIWQAAVLGFAGLSPRPDGLRLDPHLPPRWSGLTFAAQWHGRRVRVTLRRETRTMTAVLEHGPSLVMALGVQEHALEPSERWTARW